jgi:hypothetical protein
MLFGETQSRALLTAAPDGVDALLALVESHGVPVRKIGFVDGEALAVKVAGSSPRELSWPVVELHRAWDESLASYLNM